MHAFHIYSNLILLTDSKHELHSIDSLSKLQIQSERLVMMSVSLCTQTGLCYLTIQVLNTRVCFIDIWYTSLTSVHYNLEHGLVSVTESFVVYMFTKSILGSIHEIISMLDSFNLAIFITSTQNSVSLLGV